MYPFDRRRKQKRALSSLEHTIADHQRPRRGSLALLDDYAKRETTRKTYCSTVRMRLWTNFLKHAIVRTLNVIPQEIRIRCARALALDSPAVVGGIRYSEFAGNYMAHPRLSSADVRGAYSAGKERFPGAKFFLLSDIPALQISGLIKLSDPAAAELRKGDNVFLIAYESDEQATSALKRLMRLSKPADAAVQWLTPSVVFPPAYYYHQNDAARDVLVEERSLHHGKFDLLDFQNIIQAIEATRHIEGDYVEIGVYRGDSAHCALNYMKRAGIQRRSWFFDTYEGFSYPEADTSSDKVWQGSHQDTSIQQVKQFLSSFDNAQCIKGNIIQDEFPSGLQQIAVCNVDVDMYEAIGAALCKSAPLVNTGGIIILEDPGHTPHLAGAMLAFHQFMETEQAKGFTPLYFSSGQIVLVKCSRPCVP